MVREKQFLCACGERGFRHQEGENRVNDGGKRSGFQQIIIIIIISFLNRNRSKFKIIMIEGQRIIIIIIIN
jgi:hypothetical protein